MPAHHVPSTKFNTQKRAWILPVIVFSQFAGTSLWFAGNAIIQGLQIDLNLSENLAGHITSAVQFGFIIGTLVFAFFTISDRFSPSKVFFVSAIAGSLSNLGVFLWATDFGSLMILRFITGFFLAGIYPVGMKIASDWYEKGLGKALGYLVGALVLGTAFPHLLKNMTATLPWKYVIISTSVCASIGGLFIYLFVPNGPFRKQRQQLDFKVFFNVFKNKNFRSAAFGYFGHMWELYTLWAFIPFLLLSYSKLHPEIIINIPFLSFLIIGIGGIACIIGGYLAQKYGSDKIAFYSLLTSGVCCLLSLFLFQMSYFIFLTFLFIWGMVVISDSPQFSTLVAQTAPKESIGTALTIVNCIGFSITIISIQLINLLIDKISTQYVFVILGVGPIFGLYALSSSINWKSFSK